MRNQSHRGYRALDVNLGRGLSGQALPMIKRETGIFRSSCLHRDWLEIGLICRKGALDFMTKPFDQRAF